MRHPHPKFFCGVFHFVTVTRTQQDAFHQTLLQFLRPEELHWVRKEWFLALTALLKHQEWLPVPGDSHGICIARAASTSAQHQVVSQTTPSGGFYAKTSCVWNACWAQLIQSQKASLTSQVLSLLSDAFFFTGFPLSGIYNTPAEVELYLPLFPIKATLNLRHSAVSIWKFFLHEPFTRPLQAMVCQDISNFSSLLQRSLAGMKKAPPSHHPTIPPPKPQLEDSHCSLWTAKLQVGRREDWEAVDVGISFLCSRSLFPGTHS